MLPSNYRLQDYTFPPVFKELLLAPPQTIISEPVQTAVWPERPCGACIKVIAVQLSMAGLYFSPVFKLLIVVDAAAPNDHFTASPDGAVSGSGAWHIQRGCPAIVGACGSVGYFRKHIARGRN